MLRLRMLLNAARASSTISVRKYTSTASSVPACSATSNVLLNSSCVSQIVEVQEPGHEDQVPRRGDREELREPLDHAEDQRFELIHLAVGYIGASSAPIG